MKTLLRFATLSLLLLAGCCGIPAGTPPEGPIVTNTAGAERSVRGAERDLATSLSIYTLAKSPGKAISIDADAATSASAERVLREAGMVSGISAKPGAALELRSRADGNRWIFQLRDVPKNTVVWQETVVVKPEK